MWFFFGILTLTVATVAGLKARLAASWSGLSEQLGRSRFDVQEVRSKNRLLRVRIGTRAPAGFHFRVRAEHVHDRFFKWIGVSSEIQARDAEFDRSLYVESDARAVAILLRRNPALRSAFTTIFACAQSHQLKLVRVRCAYKRLWIEFKPKFEYNLFQAKNILAPALEIISQQLECFDLPSAFRKDRFVWRAACALAFSSATLTVGVLGLTRSMLGRTDILDPWLLFAACLVPATIVAVAGVCLLLAWLVGTSRAHVVLLEFLLVGGVGLWLGTYALAREANMEFDGHASTPYALADIRTEHEIRRGRRGRKHHHYYVNCADWRPSHAGERLRLEITEEDFDRMGNARAAIVYIRPGLFGFDWVEKIDPS
jgi:hypothetical protein